MMIKKQNQFSWDKFPIGFVNAVKQKAVVLPYEPSPNFIKDYRKEIDDHFLPCFESEAKEIVLHLNKMGIGAGDIKDFDSVVDYLRTCRTSKTLIKLYLKTIRKIGRGEQTMEETNNVFNINLDTAPIPDEKPFEFQQDAINMLISYFDTSQKDPKIEELGWKPALLVMPTGSGKTMTAMWFLLDHLIKNGYKVLWLTHRELLLEQAAETAKWLAKIAESSSLKNLKGRIISGLHCTPASASFELDDIIFYSIQSLGRNLDKLEFMLKGVQKEKFIVVIDEAHHTPMYTYRKTLELLKNKMPGFKLLGLTATPYRMIYTERNELNHIYNSNYFSCVTMAELINKKFLATPHTEKVKTNMDIESEITPEEKKYIENFSDINEMTAQRIAQSKKRNQCIIKQYMDNKDKYGKTIMFAVNQIHAKTLADELNETQKVRADYVITSQAGYNKDVVNKFKKNELDVLVNVQILTEGSDIPDVKSVFLTRPTQSESLLLQMIGRALRGPAMHGTDIAYIVDFYDDWSVFQKWLNPEFILEQEERVKDIQPEPKSTDKVTMDWDTVKKIYATLNRPDIEMQSFSSLPHGWYSLDYEDNTGKVSCLLVYDNARPAFEKMENDIDWIVNNKASIKMVFDRYFLDTQDPLPSDREISALLYIIFKDHKFPEYFLFQERDEKADPRKYALELYDILPKDQRERVQNIYLDNPIIEQIYGGFDEFFNIVMKYYKDILNPKNEPVDGHKTIPVSIQPTIKLSPGPKYDINQLYEKVTADMFNGKLNRPTSVAWSTKFFKGMWGYFRSSDRKLIINCRLDSPDIPQNVVEFVIYHELLHANGYMAHNKEFKENEHKFPDWQACENFLTTIYERFLID